MNHRSDFLTRKTKNQKLADSTLYKYRTLRRELQEFADAHGLRLLQDFNLDHLEIFQSTWKDGPLSSLKKLERLKALFNFASKRNWIKESPAIDMKPPSYKRKPTKPFTADEMERSLRAVDRYQDKSGKIGQANAQRLKCFILLLRYSGLRIGDAVNCKTIDIQGNSVCRVTQKTGDQIKCRLPDQLLEMFRTVPRLSNTYFFWTGKSTLHTAVGSWQRTLRKLFILAGVDGGHAHRFRDTFAVECLESGMTLLLYLNSLDMPLSELRKNITTHGSKAVRQD
jgi:integrase